MRLANLVRPAQHTASATGRGTFAGLVAAVCVTLLVWLLHSAFPKDGFLFLDIPMVAIVAYYCGSVPGFIAGLVAVLAAWYLIIPPGHSLLVSRDTLPVLVLFGAVLAATIEGAARLRGAQAASRRMAMIVQSADDAILSETLDGTILTWNAGAERLYGYAAAEVIGKSVARFAPPDRVDEQRERLALLLRGEPIQSYESVRIRKDGTSIDVAVTLSAVRDASRTVVGASAVVRDISDRKRTERHQQFLVKAADVLGASLDVQRTLEGLAALAVPMLADWCTVDLVGEDGRVARVVVAHRDPAQEALAHELRDTFPSDLGARRLGTEVIRTGRSTLLAEATDEALAQAVGDARVLAMMRELGCRSLMVVPLTAQDHVLGALAFISAESGRRYSRSDLAFAEELARHAAVAVDNARLHQTEQIQRQAIERLQAITAGLSKALTPADVAAVVIDQALPAIGASAGLVSLLSADGTALEAIRDIGLGGTLSERWRRIEIGVIETPVRHVVRTGSAVFLESLDVMAAGYSGVAATRSALPTGARAVLPLQTTGAPFGVMLFVFPTPLEFTERDRALLLAIARQCAQALDRARLYAHEHHVAEMLQRALLPLELPEVPGLRVHATYAPASPGTEIGGDWYDAFRLPDGRLALAIGDVVGHGIEAAVIMGQVRHSIRAAALDRRAPAEVLAVASEVLRLSHADEAMTTAVFGVLDPIALTFTYATAAHPAPIVAVDGRAQPLATGGLPLGFLEAQPAPSWTVELARGTLLVLYTDGLVELSRDVVAGQAALLSAVERELQTRSPDPAARILNQVVGRQRASDDIAIVVVALDAGPLERLDLVLPAAVSSLRQIRHAMQQLTEDLGVDAQRASALIIATGEAVNNTIEHAYGVTPGPVHLRARRDGGMLVVEIEDRGRWRPERQDTRGGRGITLMRGLVDSMEMTTTDAGTVVRLAIAVPSTAPPRPRAGSVLRTHETPRVSAPARQRVDDQAELDLGLVRGVPVVSLEGDLDRLNVARFTVMVEEAAADAPGLVVLSLSSASYLDSRGLQALLQVGRRITVRRCRLVLVAVPGSLARRLLDASGVGAMFRVCASVEEAAAGRDDPVA